MTQGVVNDQIILAHEASANNVEIGTANAIAGGHMLDAAGGERLHIRQPGQTAVDVVREP